MLVLEKNAKGIITDSGGVQKEAYFMKKPCFTLRDETEWVETVNTGWNKLVNPLKTSLAKVITEYRDVDYQDHLYGDGKASEKIVGLIKNYFK
jgi:UDP-N-acetylglucosamine 2-epimerase